MITFIIGLVILFGGAAIYGRFCEKVFGPDDRETPAHTKADGVDYVEMPKWKNMLINLLNIAGTGPILGPIQGILFGPLAFITIPIGNVIGGAMHDYFSGMISLRDGGAQMPEIIQRYTNKKIYYLYNAFLCLLLLLVGAVFVYTPGNLAATQLFGHKAANDDPLTWIIYGVIFAYYLIATLFPIDKIIGRVYPVFGFALLFMAVGLMTALLVKGYSIPELTLSNLRNFHVTPERFPVFPMLFITIACGAISGFHATQSPLMARCITNEKLGRRVFYGAMITESVVAMIWATISMSFFGGIEQLNQVMSEHQGNAAWVVNLISNSLLGKVGGALALLGVVAAPITSGDTAFRSARLIVADFLHLKQGPVKNRLYISIPLFAIGFLLTRTDFDIIWRYFAWANQTLATLVLWTITIYLMRRKWAFLVTFLPALFMTAVITAYLLFAPEGFALSLHIAVPAGILAAVVAGLLFFFYRNNQLKAVPPK